MAGVSLEHVSKRWIGFVGVDDFDLDSAESELLVLLGARAAARPPRCAWSRGFLMDEPLSNLDARLRVSMRAQLEHLQHDLDVTTICVTHDQIEAMTLADRVVVMSRLGVDPLEGKGWDDRGEGWRPGAE